MCVAFVNTVKLLLFARKALTIKAFLREAADKVRARIAQWPADTQVTVYGVDGNWCEVEYEGQHGWVASKYVVAYQ